MSVRQAQAEIDSAEFTEWLAYYSLEPFGTQMDDLRHGVATATLANINRDSKVRKKPYVATDFIYWREGAEETDKPVLLADPKKQAELMMTAMFGGLKVKRAPPV